MAIKKKTLIYIIGAGRSGTTLLDILLGNNNDTISLGEINRYYKRDGIPPKREQGDKVHAFWSKITVVLKTQKSSFKVLNKLFKKNEYHTNIYKSLFRLNETEYKKALKLQYNEIYKQVKESVIIESSKYPARALNISNYLNQEKEEIKFIFLKKDPVKVVKSFQKKGLEQPSKGFFMSNIYYLSVNLLCKLVVLILKLKKHDTSIIKYEDLIFNTSQTINKMSNDLNINFSLLDNKLKNKELLSTGFLFDGNRIRLKETLTLQSLEYNNKKDLKYYFARIFNIIVYR